MELTPSELVILGLVIERPSHGYDLDRVIKQRGIRQWTDVGFSSIYYLLTKLEKRDLVRGSQAAPGAKARRVFHPTAKGREIAARDACWYIAEARAIAQPFMVGIANLPLLTPHEYVEALRARLVQINARIATVKDAQQLQQPLPLAAREVFSYSLSLMEAERLWLSARVQVPND